MSGLLLVESKQIRMESGNNAVKFYSNFLDSKTSVELLMYDIMNSVKAQTEKFFVV